MTLEEARRNLQDLAEKKRIEAGNEIMNYITEYFLEQQKVYRDDFGHNYLDAMRTDKIWIFEGDEKLNELLREYFELTVG